MSADNDDIIFDIHKHHLDGTIHNYLVDHVDKSSESKQHHHHGPTDHDILIHKHDDPYNHPHNLVIHIDDGTIDNHYFGPADHDHLHNDWVDSPEVSTAIDIHDDDHSHDINHSPAPDTSPPPYFDYPSDP